jgi:predicted phosphate transport protein (TIGR00153 family)
MARLSQVFAAKDREFFDLFEEAAANNARAARLLARMLDEVPEHADMARDVVDCEHEGDRITHAILHRLNKGVAAPLEREDVLELASTLDDVVDLTEETADYLVLYKVEAPMEQALRQADILVRACDAVARALAALRRGDELSALLQEMHRLENEGDREGREAIASLFEGGIDPMVIIRWKDVFERLEEAIDATETVANVLEGIVIKRA